MLARVFNCWLNSVRIEVLTNDNEESLVLLTIAELPFNEDTEILTAGISSSNNNRFCSIFREVIKKHTRYGYF
jgi:hypothetical protein